MPARRSITCEETLKKASIYDASFQVQMLKAQNAGKLFFCQRNSRAVTKILYGFPVIFRSQIFRNSRPQPRSINGPGPWMMCQRMTQRVPTKVKYGKVSGLIRPVFDILGILPGYRESDISLWFFLFFTLFFAMIIGDAGYGCLILIATIALVAKTKKFNTTTYLLLVLSIATIVWGAVTGTWFGMEKAMHVPFLKALVIPQFANYPDYFGVCATTQQNAIMKFSFTIGAIQMALGSLISIKKKLSEKNLSWVADLGWLVAVIGMYLLSLYLVIGQKLNIKPIFGMVGIAFILVVLFGGMAPDKTIGQGLKAGLGDAFTVFLNTISCFGNVMSYIRLFAVGMAGFAISQSFNGIAAGFHGPLIILGVVVVLIGHGLNIIMCFLSVVVHGVRSKRIWNFPDRPVWSGLELHMNHLK